MEMILEHVFLDGSSLGHEHFRLTVVGRDRRRRQYRLPKGDGERFRRLMADGPVRTPFGGKHTSYVRATYQLRRRVTDEALAAYLLGRYLFFEGLWCGLGLLTIAVIVVGTLKF